MRCGNDYIGICNPWLDFLVCFILFIVSYSLLIVTYTKCFVCDSYTLLLAWHLILEHLCVPSSIFLTYFLIIPFFLFTLFFVGALSPNQSVPVFRSWTCLLFFTHDKGPQPCVATTLERPPPPVYLFQIARALSLSAAKSSHFSLWN
jgi:hypothetical protein